jgi:hypothetical protein
MSLRTEQDPQRCQTTLVIIRAKDISEQALADSLKLRQLLGLSSDATEFKLVSGSLAANDRELAVKTRSLMHILGIMAAQVEVPEEDVARGRAAPGIVDDRQGVTPVRLARIFSSQQKPAQAYVAVKYRNYWFWIEDEDLKTKRAFASTMMLFTLMDAGEKQATPALTIPTQ